MHFFLRLQDGSFKAIQNGAKKVEGRVPTKDKTLPEKNMYAQMLAGDSITFTNITTQEKMTVKIMYVYHYPDSKSMLEKEGVENVLTGEKKTIEDGIEVYNQIPGYRENIPLFGIYAIGIKVIK